MELKRKTSRLRRYHLVAMKLNRDEWQAYVALHRAAGASAAESIRAHIRAGLALIPVILLLYLLAQRRRRAYAMRFTNLALLQKVAGRAPA